MQTFFLPHAFWLEACLECLGRGLLITITAAGIRLSPWLQGCCWVGWAFRSYPLSPGALTSAVSRSISCRCTRLTQTECAVKWDLLSIRTLSPSHLSFLRLNKVSLGRALKQAFTGSVWDLHKKREVPFSLIVQQLLNLFYFIPHVHTHIHTHTHTHTHTYIYTHMHDFMITSLMLWSIQFQKTAINSPWQQQVDIFKMLVSMTCFI